MKVLAGTTGPVEGGGRQPATLHRTGDGDGAEITVDIVTRAARANGKIALRYEHHLHAVHLEIVK